MAAIPEASHTTAAAVLRWWEANQEAEHRPHLGASQIGHQCERYLWLTFHWAGKQSFDGRMLRLFDTGKREESRVYQELRGIGCTVWADDGTAQFKVSALGGHFGGSMDGVVQGLPEAPATPHVLEIKTHSAKSFAELKKLGMAQAKPQHYAQMQTYMMLADLTRGLYYAVNKDTDELHIERIERDDTACEQIMARAQRVIEAKEPPQRLSEDPAFYLCKWCHFHPQCHGEALPDVNCRTCAHSTPRTDEDGGRWHCGLEDLMLDVHTQRDGCTGHRYIPILLQRVAEQVDAVEEQGGNHAVVYRLPDGSTFANGYAPHYLSREIKAAKDLHLLDDEQVKQVKAEFRTAEVVG